MYIKSVNSDSSTNYKTSKTTYTDTSNNSFSSSLNSALNSTNLDNIFQRASEKYGVSINLLKAVAKAESGFNVNAQSKAGAQGIMQLMPSTSKSLGVTNPFDAEQNIMGGAKLLSQFIDKYDGNTKLALAAYNAGPGNVSKYGGIPPFKETQNYVKKVMGYCGESITIPSDKNNISSIKSTLVNSTDNTSKTSGSTSSSEYLNTPEDEIEKMILMNMLQNEFQKSRIKFLNSEEEV